MRLIGKRCGALVRDDFNDDTVDLHRWEFWHTDAEMTIEETRGMLRVHGTTSNSLMPGSSWRSCGLVSRLFATPDVELVAEMKVPLASPRVGEPDSSHVHLCNAIPDIYPEVIYDSRGWLFSGSSKHAPGDHFEKRRIEPFGDEEDTFHLVKVRCEGPTGLCSGYVHDGERWIQMGTQRIPMRYSRIELKITATQPDITLDTQWNNVRMYPNPDRHPVLFHLSGADREAAERMSVRLFKMDGTLVAESGFEPQRKPSPPQFGCSIELDGKWDVYPASCIIKVFDGERQIGEDLTVKSEGVEGLYPNDLWRIHL